MISYLLQDLNANRGNTKGVIVCIFFRAAQITQFNLFTKVLFIPYIIFYQLLVEWFMGIELPFKGKVGKGLRIFHGHGLVVNNDVVIGDFCTLRQGVTIGSKLLHSNIASKSPIIGDNVDIGANTCIIGEVKLGNNVTIGAGAIVTKDFPSFTVIAGNPAKIIKFKKQ